MRKPELLAPAGDLYRCKTAIRYGADAVYLGGQRFSLRSRASNFSLADIREACRYAAAHQARIHVTVNIIPHDEDFVGLPEYLQQLQDAGVTAVIEASPAVMALTRACAPGLQVHCSTQMSVTNAAAACFLRQQLDIQRVVLARECTMDQVRQITAACGMETEAFIHGGMCVNYSGRCTLSNRMTDRDANRGGCAQSCRWQYDLCQNGQPIDSSLRRFTMGSRDLCAADWIYDLMAAGVSSLKIEGRMKTEYYVASIVHAYRQLIDEISQNGGRLSEARMAYYRRQILRGENRQTWSGFYGAAGGADSLIDHPNSDADVNHDFLATVVSYDAGRQTAVIQTRNPFVRGQKAEVLCPNQPDRTFCIDWIRSADGEYLERSSRPMAVLEIPLPFAAARDDILRRAEE